MLGNALAVTGNAAMTVNVNTGLVLMPNSAAWGGMYLGYNTASYVVTVPASNSSQWRRDYIAAVMTDAGTSAAAWDIVDVPGAFSSSAPGSLPSLPANSVPIAIVNVVPNMTVTNGGGTVQDARVYQPLSGAWPTTSGSRPSLSAPAGTTWYEADTQQYGIIIAGAYHYIPTSPLAVDTWHDLRPCSAGFNGTNTGHYPPQYRMMDDGKHVEVIGDVGVPASSFNGVQVFTNAIPAAYRPNHNVTLPASEDTSVSDGARVFVLANGTMQFAGLAVGSQIVHFGFTYPLDSSGLIQS